MPIAINNILLILSIILLFTLFIGTHTTDIAYSNHIIETNHEEQSPESIHYMAKRRFLPTRRELDQNVNDNNEDNESHLNAKRYFLKSKRYFLKSKREDE
ncbi:unnamed protein product [Adineta steineri]|uniref:Uncharacterized protein n=1 Tax=Adineta steineri TaxID=433720 RepID=A0A816F738_9BILA|nr:unnamed protein product [Adineta steineri]CAF1655771.1 unnamed protein product [Adineta steineri]